MSTVRIYIYGNFRIFCGELRRVDVCGCVS
jgi:hypothetical protein